MFLLETPEQGRYTFDRLTLVFVVILLGVEFHLLYYSIQTSIVRRYCHQEFSRQYFPTAGVDFFLKRITVHGNKDATIQLWDVGGSALDGNMLDKYIFGAHVSISYFKSPIEHFDSNTTLFTSYHGTYTFKIRE